MDRLKVDDDTPIESRMITKSLESAQKKVEGFNFDTRKNVVKYDDVMNRHRKAIYALRSEVLRAEDISARVKKFISEEAAALVSHPDSMTEAFEAMLGEVFPFDEPTMDKLFDMPSDKFPGELEKAALKLYTEQEKDFKPEMFRKVESDVYLQILDNLWMQHLENMEHLREGIHWIAVGQRDPLVEYRKQGQILFDDMQITLRHDIVRAILHAQPLPEEDMARPVETELTRAARSSVDNASQVTSTVTFSESDFIDTQAEQAEQARFKAERKKARKVERQRKKAGKKPKKRKKK
jgi:preprotein translocase subunit SecA